MLSNLFVYGQFKNFGDTTKNKPDLNYKYSVYAYGDIVRELGIGFQYQLGNKFNFDVSLYNVRPNLQIKKTVKEADYFDYSGFGISFKPKYLISRRNRLYVGASLGYEYLSHGVIFVDRSTPHIDIYSTESVKGSVYNVGFTFGNKFRYKQLLIEPFCGAGFVFNKTTAIVYAAKNNPDFRYQTFPLTYEHKDGYGFLNAGIKLGYSFKNNRKKDKAIDKKFRDDFNPRLDSLTRLFYLIEYHRPFLFEAFLNYKDLNKKAVKQYSWHYGDTTKLYKNMNLLFNEIDELIILHNEIKAAVDSAYNRRKEGFANYFKTVDVTDKNTPSNIKKAYRRYRGLDRLILRYYGVYKRNKKGFYKKIDHLFYNIDKLINPESK